MKRGGALGKARLARSARTGRYSSFVPKEGKQKSDGENYKAFEATHGHGSKVEDGMSAVMKKHENGEGEQSKKRNAWTNVENRGMHSQSHDARNHIERVLGEYWKAYKDSQECGQDLRFAQVQQKLFEVLESADVYAYQLAENFMEVAGLVRRQTELRRPVRKEIYRVRKDRRCESDNVLRSSKSQRELINETKRAERRIKKKAPELIVVADSIRRLRFLAKHLTSDYGYWRDEGAERRPKKAAKKSCKNPRIVTRVRKAGEAHLQTREGFEKAYLELEGENPSNYQFPISRSSLTQFLEGSEGA